MKSPYVVKWLSRTLLGLLVLLLTHVFLVWQSDPRLLVPLAPRELVRAPRVANEATLLFLGDTAEADAALPTLQARGLRYPFGATLDFLNEADLVVANLEAPITDGGDRFPLYNEYLYRAPAESASALAWAGVDVLSLANNHALDYGVRGLFDTVANIARSGMETVGAGEDAASARRGLIVYLGDVRVGLLAYCEAQLVWRVWMDLFARTRHPGVAALSERALAEDIGRLRKHSDVVVVMLHVGDNYAPPRRTTLDWSRRAIELGADLVVCHHPHVAHPLMMHHGRPIALSLGNYAFGTPGHPSLDHGYLLFAHVRDRHLDRLEVAPIAVQNRRVQFQPQPLVGPELKAALEKLRAASAPLGAAVRIEGGRGVLDLALGST